MAHELKWGVGGGLGIILVGHLAKGVGLIGEERLIPFLAGGAALILYSLIVLLIPDRPSTPLKLVSIPPAEPLETTTKDAASGIPEQQTIFVAPPQLQLGLQTALPSWSPANGSHPTPRTNQLRRSADEAARPAWPSSRGPRAHSFLFLLNSDDRTADTDERLRKLTIFFELQRIIQRWLRTENADPFAAFVCQRGFFLAEGAVLGADLVSRLQAAASTGCTDPSTEAELLLAYIRRIERLSDEWEISTQWTMMDSIFCGTARKGAGEGLCASAVEPGKRNATAAVGLTG
jgi:hypothetical protein